MKAVKQINIGSQVFFNKFEDYNPKDYDILYLMDDWRIVKTNVLTYKKNNKDIFLFKNLSKDEFIENTLNCPTPMRIGKFLVPEFVEYIKLTINDLKRLEPKVNELDDKHKYEKIIYDSYIENNDFVLTEKQLQNAYNEYRKYRG